MCVSDFVEPGLSALVESASSRRTPSSLRDGGDAIDIGDTPIDGQWVDLEVARVHDHALRCAKHRQQRRRRRVGDRQELAVERADAPPLVITDRDQLGAVEQTGFVELVAHETRA